MIKVVEDFVTHTGLTEVLIILDRVQKLEIERPMVGWSDNETPQYGQLTDQEADNARMALLLRLQ
jgi:hypothetical protein